MTTAFLRLLARLRARGCGQGCLAIQGFPLARWAEIDPADAMDWADGQLRELAGNCFSMCALMPLQLAVMACCPIAQAILLVTTDSGQDCVVVADDSPAKDPQCRGSGGAIAMRWFRGHRARPRASQSLLTFSSQWSSLGWA